MNKRNYKTTLGLLSILIPTLAQANYQDDIYPLPEVFTASFGPAWANGGSTQTFELWPGMNNTYFANNNSSTIFNGELFWGMQAPVASGTVGQLGVAGGWDTQATLNGEVWSNANPDNHFFNYSYHVSHSHVALKGKLLTDFPIYDIQAFIFASLGVGFNKSGGFTITTINPAYVPPPAFKSYTNTSFTYTVGFGAQKMINHRWAVSLGFEFADWGTNKLGKTQNQTLNHGLWLSHLFTNTLQFGVSYFFNLL